MPETPSRAEQIAEAQARELQRGTSEIETPVEPDTDSIEGESAVTRVARDAPKPGEGDGRKAPVVRSPHDQKRSEIISRFRTDRSVDTEAADDAKELREFARQGMPPELLEPEATPPAPEAGEGEGETPPEPEAPPEPVKRKLKVRGKEVELSDEEVLALAQKAAAADDYLGEARQTLDNAKSLQKEIEATRTAPPGKHPTGSDAAQPPEPAKTPDASEHPVSPFAKLVEAIQFGDPNDAGKSLEELINTEVDKRTKPAAKEVLEQQRMADEAARSKKYLDDFRSENKEIASDPFANAVIERMLIQKQLEDIKELGVDESQLPKTPGDIVQWHLWYRTNGYKVRDVTTLLKTSRDEFVEWKGVGEKPKPATGKAPPRVEVKVDRTARRAAIPQTPASTVNPRPDSQTQSTAPRDRSDVVQQMIRSRAAPRGRIVA